MRIVFEHVGKTFLKNFSRKPVDAVSDLNLEIKSGEIFGIIGPNGAGKSTLLKMLMGYIRPTEGAISILGAPPQDPTVKKKIGYLPENPYYYDHLSADELLRFSARASGMLKKDISPRIEHLLEKLSLTHARKRKLREYSKGMTQRAGICFSLVHDPELVILDEPMSGLDPIGRKDVVQIVLDLKEAGKTVLFCSHILNDVEKLCDRMAIMNKGRLKRIMTKADLRNTGQQVALLCDAIPEGLSRELLARDVHLDTAANPCRLVCEKTNLNDVLSMLNAHGVAVRDIEIAEDTLEKLFFETINDGA